MLESLWKKILRRERYSPWWLIMPLLWLAAAVYRLLSVLHRVRVRPVAASVPVISVGNITVGGTGKTPLVQSLAVGMINEGVRVGIVSSGYGRRSTAPIIEPGYRLQQMNSLDTGDETKLLSTLVPRAMFSIDNSKANAAIRLANSGEIDLIIVDDGFQHFELQRDVDIVTFDAALSDRLLRPFPAGMCREGMSSLKRADILVITRAGFATDLQELRQRLQQAAPSAQHYSAQFQISELIGTQRSLPVKYLKDKSIFLFAGIGNFDVLRREVDSHAGDLDGWLELSDHQEYSPELLDRIREEAERYGSDLIVTTGKDWVKLNDFDFGRETYYLSQTIDLDPGEEKLIAALLHSLQLEGRRR
ncbi:MAG: tetraacyldisaccharide 4'-kinase [Candidatus Zixiibacteriota bacterium]